MMKILKTFATKILKLNYIYFTFFKYLLMCKTKNIHLEKKHK